MKLRGNKNAHKINRKIELGWMHDDKHIRTNNGGGSRKIELHRQSKKADILKEAFFPNGESRKIYYCHQLHAKYQISLRLNLMTV